MDVVSFTATLLFPLAKIFREITKGIDTVKKLFKDESYGTLVVDFLKSVLHEIEGKELREDVSDSDKILYLRLQAVCTQLYQQIEILRDQYQRRRHDRWGRWCTYQSAFSKLRKLKPEFQSVVSLIGQTKIVTEFMGRVQGDKHDMTKLTKQVQEMSLHSRQVQDSVESNRDRSHRASRWHQYRVQKPRATRSRRSSYETRRALERRIDHRQAKGSCRNCGRYGHWEHQCFKRCFICNGTDHTATYC
ncbi:hypothetical protein ASPVEDRAFT_713681 [Aspergillus versicolor CBS 583.65]|uniref:CCHC-type domain-containing protein n=1 Tax=Aspergillus versicolor CBS 583.65 TaxID=1036611 RepID=A0A1L9PNH8_ASPVE|nr:uncharacterized protein ASPVEDRAFT_713681 [Aspergillus versicolor CBS 583.65]OJJ03078.1 hypothetical protein ASPVEDRAFT_713681 [Aspergillus versicolor CBS 583.65]